MRIVIALAFCLPLAASTLDYTMEFCGADCPKPYYAMEKPASPQVPSTELLRAYIGGPAGYYTIHATDWREGWTVGDFYGPSSWEGSWVFDGKTVYCCSKYDDERWMLSVNDYGDSVSIMSSATIVRLMGYGEIIFNRTLGIGRIDDNGVLYGNGFVMRPPAPLHQEAEGFAVAASFMSVPMTENPEPNALWLLAGGVVLIALRLRRASV